MQKFNLELDHEWVKSLIDKNGVYDYNMLV
jgi:hypothetical protein